MATSLRPLLRETTREDYLHAAIQTAKYINTRIVETEHGIYFSDPNEEKESFDSGIYSGTAGIILFYLELYKVTKDDEYIRIAERAGDYLIYDLSKRTLSDYRPGLLGLEYKKAQWNFTSGYTGVAFALIEIDKLSDSSTYKIAAESIINQLIDDREETEHGIIWSGESGILADGGVLLFLLKAAEYYENDDWKEVAIKAGYHILSTAEVVDDDSIKFHPLSQDIIVEFNGLDPNITYEFPNWEYGTAGTGYILARLYQETEDEVFLKAAKKAANYTQSLAVEVGEDGHLIPYRLPDLDDLYYMSYCHGPVGDARVFELLYEITGEQSYRDEVQRLAKGILNTDAPHVHSDGYWHFYGQCCGTAGMIEFFIDLDKEWSDDTYKEKAIDGAEKILSESFIAEEGVNWPQAFWRTKPEHVTIDIGYFDGAAGIAISLLHLYQALDGNYDFIEFPGHPSFRSKQ